MLHLKSLPPSAVDFEIRSLSTADEARDAHLFLAMLTEQLGTCRNYELLQSFINVFLRAHGDALAQRGRFAAALVRLAEAQNAAWARLQDMIDEDICLVDFARNAPI